MQIDATLRNAGGVDLEKRSAGDLDYGAYGFLFRDVRSVPWQPGPREGNPREEIFRLSEQLYGESDPNPEIAAGYTYFGQFVTHDLTFALTPFGARLGQGLPGRNQRTPRFDLDSVYGGGPVAQPFLYELANPQRLLVGRTASRERDLPRNGDDGL